MNRTRNSDGLPISRRVLVAFVVVCFLSATTGAVSLFHHHDQHGADSQCQICHLLTVAAIGQIVALIVLFLIAGSSQRRPVVLAVAAESADFLVTAAPRAPPSHRF